MLIKAVICNRNREEHIEQIVINVDPWKGVNYSSARVLCLCSPSVDTYLFSGSGFKFVSNEGGRIMHPFENKP